jgi:hypothetical protein
VRSFAECDVVIRVAGDVEVVRLIEFIGVAVGRGQQRDHRRSPRNRDAMQLETCRGLFRLGCLQGGFAWLGMFEPSGDLRDNQTRPLSDWGSSGRRFKSCQPDSEK